MVQYITLSSKTSIIKIRITILIFLIVLFSNFSISAQSNIIFVDSSKVRETPSANAKILGILKHNSSVDICPNEPMDYKIQKKWQPINFNGKIAFIWEESLAHGWLNDLTNENVQILYRIKDKTIVEFKVFKKNVLIHTCSFNLQSLNFEWSEIRSIGKTAFSKNAIFALIDAEKKYQMFEWTGIEILKSKVKLLDESRLTELKNDSALSFAAKNATPLFAGKDSTIAPILKIPIDSRLKVFIEDKYNYQDWYQVEYKNQPYYIRYQDLGLTFNCIQSNKHPGLSFIKTNTAIYALRGQKIIDKLEITEYNGQEEIYEISSLGLDSKLDFLGVAIRCYTEGCNNGRIIYTWNGKKIKYLCADVESWDFGYAGGSSFSFPNENDESKIKLQNYEKAFFNDPFNKNVSDCFLVDYMYSDEHYEFKLLNDSLVEVPTFESKFRKYFSTQFKNQRLAHCYSCDLNGDGLKDMVFYYNQIDSNSGTFTQQKIGYCLTNSKGYFQKVVSNSTLLSDTTLAVKFEFDANELIITTIENYFPTEEDGYIIEENTAEDVNTNENYSDNMKVVKYKFTYDSSVKRLRLKSSTTSIGIYKDYFIYQWNIQKTIRARSSFFFDNCIKN